MTSTRLAISALLAALIAALGPVAACGPTAPNLGCADAILPGDLVITEVFADFASGSAGGGDTGKEWFEVFNASDHPIEMQGLTLTSSRQDGTSPQTHRMREVVIAPGQYFVLGNEDPAALSAYVNYGYGGDLGEMFNSGGGQLALSCGSAAIDAAQYADVKPGHSRELTSAQPPDYTLTDDLANWCQGDATEFDHGNFGTPGDESDCEPLTVGQCNDAGTARAIVSPSPGDLVITEIMADPAKVADTAGEWFEAVVINDTDLNGVGLDRAADTLAPDVVAATDCLHVVAGDTLVFARNADTTINGGLPNVASTFTFSMPSGTVAAPGDVQLLVGTTVIDAVTWTSATSGKSRQLDPSKTDPQANDDPANFCDSVTPYGLGDLGTPGDANATCSTLPTTGMCTDATTGQARAIVKPAARALVITEVMPNPAGDETKREWIEITNTGAAAFDLNELGIDRADDSRPPDVIDAADCKTVAPGGFALFARSTDATANGGLTTVDATFGFTMLNTSGSAQILDGTTVLDAVTWTTTKDGESLQLDPGETSTTANDVPANFCLGTTPYGDDSNKGTPRAANVSCAAP